MNPWGSSFGSAWGTSWDIRNKWGTSWGTSWGTTWGGNPGTNTGSITLRSLSVISSGTLEINDIGAVPDIPLPSMTVTGTGSVGGGYSGTGLVDMPRITVAGIGTLVDTGTGAVTLPSLSVNGAGAVGTNINGGAAVTLASLSVAASGTITLPNVSGSGAMTLPHLTVSASGNSVIHVDPLYIVVAKRRNFLVIKGN